MVEYGVDNGFDAWRRLYNHDLPLAEDLQQILIQELYALQPVTENNIDTLLNQVERVIELYTRAGKADDAISDKWIKVAVLRNLPKQVTKDHALQLKDAQYVDDVRNIVNIYLHDHQMGMPRGQSGPMLCATTNDQEDTEGNTSERGQDNSSANTNKVQSNGNGTEKDENTNWHGSNDLNATTKGSGKNKKRGKGYGGFWHCGEWGHPRRECLHLNDFAKGKGTVAALKGGKYGGGKGKGKFGKGRGKGNGKGKWGKGCSYNCNNNYRAPGKGVGKGLNQLDEDWYNAWGSDYNDYDNYGDDYSNDYSNWGGHFVLILYVLFNWFSIHFKFCSCPTEM